MASREEKPAPRKVTQLHRPTKEELKVIDKKMADRRAFIEKTEKEWGKP